jgi:hypothetical protein
VVYKLGGREPQIRRDNLALPRDFGSGTRFATANHVMHQADVTTSTIGAAVATCAFCGARAASNTMDMTGHGLRCMACTTRANITVAANGGSDMGEHLSWYELARVVESGRREAMIGAALALGGTVLTLLSLAAGGTVVVFCGGAMASGCGMLAHGLHRSRQAATALGSVPQARKFREW